MWYFADQPEKAFDFFATAHTKVLLKAFQDVLNKNLKQLQQSSNQSRHSLKTPRVHLTLDDIPEIVKTWQSFQ